MPAALLAAVFAVNGLAILAFWWFSSGSLPVRGAADLLNVLGRLTALAGTYLVLWQLLLISRVPWTERAIGMERNLRLHRLNAYLALGLIGAHAVFQTAGYMAGDGLSAVAQTADFISHYEGLLMAIVALALMLGVVLVSIGLPRRQVSYETWYFIHLYVYLAVALAFLHQLTTGLDFIHNPWFAGYWIALYVVVASAVLGFRIAQPLARWRRHNLQVLETVREASRTTSIYVGGEGLDRIRYRPGQFMIWRFLDRRRWSQAHPFSLSSVPNADHLRLTVRANGDFSKDVAALRPGTPVLVEGPFGSFTIDACRGDKALLVAAGIGITPLRALAEEMGERGMDVCLIYRVRRAQDVVFGGELHDLQTALGVRVEILIRELDAKRKSPSADWLRPHNLVRLVPDIRDRDVFVCGPAAMLADARRSLEALGLEPDRVHVEVFRF
jgi:predicted ferric reductase